MLTECLAIMPLWQTKQAGEMRVYKFSIGEAQLVNLIDAETNS